MARTTNLFRRIFEKSEVEESYNAAITKNPALSNGQSDDETAMAAEQLFAPVTKQDVKKQYKTKWVVGDTYVLKRRNRLTKKTVSKTFVLKKFAYTINNSEVGIVIMKQIDGPQDTIFTLNKFDCLDLHVKYEEGLQVFSMGLNWYRQKSKKKSQKIA